MNKLKQSFPSRPVRNRIIVWCVLCFTLIGWSVTQTGKVPRGKNKPGAAQAAFWKEQPVRLISAAWKETARPEEVFTDPQGSRAVNLPGHLILQQRTLPPAISPVSSSSATTVLKIDTLSGSALPAMAPGMVNVTGNQSGYQARLNGSRQTLAINYDRSRLPAGYGETAIHTYWYDPTATDWKELPTDSLDSDRQLVFSTATKDGDYVNAILKAPETPETQGYVPATMSDMKLGDPGANVQLINPPAVNNRGSANLNYPIQIPPGRQGMQPELNITYSSDAGNGWLGEGWNLSLSSISVDTRWGVPRYTAATESETYLLDGQMLAFIDNGIAKTANRDLGVLRTTITKNNITIFHPRKESGFELIQRMGNSPSTYYWVVTNKSGTKYFYGGINQLQENAVLRDQNNQKNIAEWKLVRVQDVFGNQVNYAYDPIAENNAVYLYPRLITYTQHDLDPNGSFYQVVFEYDPNPHPDALQLNARYGFLVNPSARRLGKISISRVSDNTLYNLLAVRSYQLQYKSGAFGKTLLGSITQYGDDGKEFNHHTFSYYNEDNSMPYYVSAGSVKVNDQSLGGEIPGILGITNNSSTAIGGSKSSGNTAGIYVGVGSGNPASVNISGGIQYNNTSGSSNGLNTLVDMDGDGLPDKLYAKDGKLYYEKNISEGNSIAFDPKPISIQGFSDFMQQNSRTTGWGAQVYFGVTASFDAASTESSVSTYLTDVNGDGLTDIVKGTVVYFNTGVISHGALIFSQLSSQTHAPINGTGKVSTTFVYDNAIDKDLVKNNPLQEVVHFWEAPFDGIVDLSGTAAMIQPKNPGSDLDDADGLWLTIESSTISRTANPPLHIPGKDYNPHALSIKNITVKKGQRIFFRAQSGVKDDDNGAYDQVSWDPMIIYTSSPQMGIDAAVRNPAILRYQYQASKDFLLSSAEPVTIPPGVTSFDLDGKFSKEATMDTIWVEVNQLKKDQTRPYLDAKGNEVKDDKGNTVYYYTFDKNLAQLMCKPDEVISGLKQTVKYPENSADTRVQFIVRTKVNIDLNHLAWEPVISYLQPFKKTKFVNNVPGEGADTLIPQKKYIVPQSVFNDTLKYSGTYTAAAKDTSYNIYPSLTLSGRGVSGTFMLAAKTTTTVLAKQLVSYRNGLLENARPLIIKVSKNDPYTVSLEANNTPDGKQKDTAYQAVCDKILNTGYLVAASKVNSAVLKIPNPKPNTAGYTITIPQEGSYRISPDVQIKSNTKKGNLWIEVWINNTLHKFAGQDTLISYDGTTITYPVNQLSIGLKINDQVSVQYICKDSVLLANGSITGAFATGQFFPAEFWVNRRNESFGPMFRGWGQFIYNGMDGRAAKAIDESTLKLAKASVDAVNVDAFKASVQNAVNTQTVPPRDPSLDRLSIANSVFVSMLPYADAGRRCWVGGEDSIYLKKDKMSPSRLGINNVKSINPFATAVSTAADNSYGRAITKLSTGSSQTFSGGYGFLSKSNSNDFSTLIADYMDLNGDHYPDIISGSNVQVTLPNGALGEFYIAPQDLHTSSGHTDGLSINGTIGRSSIQFTGFTDRNRGIGSSVINAGTATEAGQQASMDIAASGATNSSNENVKTTWLDINGDGLPDHVTPGGYDLNLGYNRFIHFNIPLGGINNSSSKSISPGITAGFSYDDNSFSGGAGLSFSNSQNDFLLQDINGDGLPDKVTFANNGDMTVAFNTGNNFLPAVNCISFARGGTSFGTLGDAASFDPGFLPRTTGGFLNDWFESERKKSNSSNGVSLGGSLSFGFSIWLVKIVIRPSFNHSMGVGRTIRQISDINGDGLPDFIYSTKEGNMEVMLSNLGKSNKLKEVDNPLGGSFTLDYQHAGNSATYPGGKWVMSSLQVNDGIASDRTDPKADFDNKKIFKYIGGKFDPWERDFLGFAQVVSTGLDFKSSPYRQLTQTYDTRDYYTAGHLTEEVVSDPAKPDRKFSITRNHYATINIYSHPSTVGAFSAETGVLYSPLASTTNGTWEGGATLVWQNRSTYAYKDPHGLLTRFTYKENPGAEEEDDFDYQTTVTYDSADATYYVLGQPADVLTKGKDNTVYRHVSAEYYPWSSTLNGNNVMNKHRLWKYHVYLTDGHKTTTQYFYNYPFGNMTAQVLPDGRLIGYDYDGDITPHTANQSNSKTFITKVENKTFHFSSSMTYDYRYGVPVETVDIADNRIGYRLDHFGRTVRVIGPKECQDPNSAFNCPPGTYTIKVDYSLNGTLKAKTPLARVSHFDFSNTGEGIQTLNFTDGFNRTVQVKKTAALTAPDGTLDHTTRWVVSGRVIYDAFGRQAQLYYPQKDATDGLDLLETVNPTKPTTFEYDLQDRITAKNFPDVPALTTSYATEGSRTTATTTYFNIPANGGDQHRKTVFNGSGLQERQLVLLKDGSSLQTWFLYDPFHQLLQVTDNKGVHTTYGYDQAGHTVMVSDPDGGKSTSAYDDAGRLSDRQTAAGDPIHYSYRNNYLTAITYTRHPENNVKYVYGSNQDCKNCRDKLIYQEDASGNQSFTYGEMGERTSVSRTMIAPFSNKVYTFVTTFDYDSWNRVKSITYPDAERIDYTYNPAGQVVRLRGNRLNAANPFDYVSYIGYNEFDQRTTMVMGNKVTASFGYDPVRLRLNTTKVSNLTGATPFSTYSATYQYDNQDNLISSTNSRNAAALGATFTYDELNRLATAGGNWNDGTQYAGYNLGLSYDNGFNIRQKNLALTTGSAKTPVISYADDFAYTDPGAPHHLSLLTENITRKDGSEKKQEAYGYDGNGNNTKKFLTGFTGNPPVSERRILWDEQNRINAVSMNGYVSHYFYDADGERSVKLSEENNGLYINGKYAKAKTTPVSFVLYTNPYYTMRNGDQLYTKHIYIGSQRILSQLENEQSFGDKKYIPSSQLLIVGCPAIDPQGSVKLEARRAALNKRVNADLDQLQLQHLQVTANVFDNGTTPDEEPVTAPNHPETNTIKTKYGPGPVLLSYYYHNNLNGSTSFISDDKGSVIQYLEYLPFGETFMEYRKNYDSQFKFNGKQEDRETGLYYFGSRYYDNHSYQWLSTDPQASKYPGTSPYNYALNNPVKYKDPTGTMPLSCNEDGDFQPEQSNFQDVIGQATGESGSYNGKEDKLEAKKMITSALDLTFNGLENLTGKTRLGSNLKPYFEKASGLVFQGNQYVKTIGLEKLGKLGGWGLFGYQFIDNLHGYLKYRDDPYADGAVSPGKFAGETTLGVMGLAGFPIPGLVYGIIDAGYPGGFPKAMEFQDKLIKENQQVIPNFNIYGEGAKY